MPFETEQSTLDSGVLILALSGSMTMGNELRRFEWMIEELAKKNQHRIVIDMSNVSYLDSSAIGVLVVCYGLVKDSGGQLRLAGLTSRVAAVFKMSGVDGLLPSDQTRDEAVSALTRGA